MSNNLLKFVNVFRFTLYTLGIVVVAITALTNLTSCKRSEPTKAPLASSLAFWPPDMVPHPMPPEDHRKDDNMA